jgi:hypothetical protein
MCAALLSDDILCGGILFLVHIATKQLIMTNEIMTEVWHLTGLRDPGSEPWEIVLFID